MNYEFALDKKAIISLIAGWVVISVLLFFAGWIVGTQWPMSASASTPSAAAEEQRAQLPKEPLLNDEAVFKSNANPRDSAKPNFKLPANGPETSAETSPETSQAAAAPATDKGIVIISEAETDTANEEELAATQPEYVTVQVGVFLDQKDASRLLKDIESKGYSPTFFTGRDAEARQWYAVRIGMYSDKQQAANAAANFTKQEKIKAVVRPLESL
jgi:cell division septation protein DedD